MPNRIWSDEKNDWIIVDDATNQAINVEVLDGKGYYRNPKLDEEGNPIEGEFSDDFLSVEECLEKIGDKMNSGDIGAIGEIKDEPHLHFTLFKDNNNIDPTYIFK